MSGSCPWAYMLIGPTILHDNYIFTTCRPYIIRLLLIAPFTITAMPPLFLFLMNLGWLYCCCWRQTPFYKDGGSRDGALCVLQRSKRPSRISFTQLAPCTIRTTKICIIRCRQTTAQGLQGGWLTLVNLTDYVEKKEICFKCFGFCRNVRCLTGPCSNTLDGAFWTPVILRKHVKHMVRRIYKWNPLFHIPVEIYFIV